MNIHLVWIRRTATAAVVAAASAGPVAAQYAPYRPIPQQPAATTQQQSAQATASVAAQPPYWQLAAQQAAAQQAAGAPAVGQRYQSPAATAQYPQTAAPYVPMASAAQAPAYAPTAAQYPTTSGYPAYPHVAYQPAEAAPAAPTPSEEAMPAPVQDGAPMNGATNGAPHNGEVAPANGNGYGANCNYSNGAMYPAGSHYTGDAACGSDYGLSSYFHNPCHDVQWFGGVYWLFMNRDNPDFQRFTAQFDTPAGGYPYYPTSDVTMLSSPDVDHEYRSGGEVRFGSTLGGWGWGHDDCNECESGYGNYGHHGGDCHGCASCPTAVWAWEFGYWILDDDESTVEVADSIPTDTYRMYGMKNFAGLQYNGEPVNLWYDYQVPVQDPAGPPPWGTGTLVRVLAQRVRSNFQAQNLELNFLRLPLCGEAACGPGYGSHGDDECETGDCAPACSSPFSVTTLCGFRYLRIDDDFEYATMWAIDDGTGTLTPPAYTPWDGAGELFYDIQVDNHLAGFQLGANMNYCVTCKCNLFWNSNFGLYNNHIESYQRVYGALGPATWVGSGEDAVIDADKDDVAFVGEWLLGGSYQFTSNWRGVLAYRAVAISGVALSVDQMPEDFSNEAEVALVDSDGSLIIHGVQVGAECRY